MNSIGLCACFQCNVTPKNVKTNKILPKFSNINDLNLAAEESVLLSIHKLFSSQCFEIPPCLDDFFGTLMK